MLPEQSCAPSLFIPAVSTLAKTASSRLRLLTTRRQTRDKHFEHIAKHFRGWLRRQTLGVQGADAQLDAAATGQAHLEDLHLAKGETAAAVLEGTRSSGDLKRMLECRHLGNDISTLVRLAYILGTAPFTSPGTPPPSEIDVYFQLPYRSLCLIDSPGHSSQASVTPKSEDDSSSIFTHLRRDGLADQA